MKLEQEFISNDNSMDLTSNVETFPLDIGNDEILNFFLKRIEIFINNI